MRKQHIILVLMAGLLIISLVAFLPSASRSSVSITVVGSTNLSGIPSVVVAVSNSLPQSIHCLGIFTVRTSAGGATVSARPAQVPPRSSVMVVSGIPQALFTGPCSIWAPWEVSWRWRLQQWTQSAGFIPQRIRDLVPKYHIAKSADYVP